jgi:hypothetical protein
MYEAAQLGAVIAPPMPAFYSQPKTIDDLINHSVGRVLDLFDLDAGILKRWEGQNGRSDKPAENEKSDMAKTPHKVFAAK